MPQAWECQDAGVAEYPPWVTVVRRKGKAKGKGKGDSEGKGKLSQLENSKEWVCRVCATTHWNPLCRA
eukprot:2523174-Alexandrium_andersonii.AAC.1